MCRKSIYLISFVLVLGLIGNASGQMGLKASKQSPVEFLLDHLGVKAAANFDMAAYLEQLSAKGKERGYKEFVYKQTPQGELRMYFAMPADWSPNDKRPAAIFFYGGGWIGGNVFALHEEAEYFAKCGVVAGMADYRVRNRHGVMLDKCVEDARSAVRWVRANCRNLGVDPKRVIAGGGSAGGHIAACTAIIDAPDSDTDDLRVSCIPDGLLLAYPVLNLVAGRWSHAKEELSKRGIGEDLANKLSPSRHVTKAWPPTVLFIGTADIGLTNGVLFHNKAKEADVTVELYLAEGRGHGVRRVVNSGPRDFISSKYAADFFMRAGVMDKGPLPDAPPGEWQKYNGEPIETILIRTNVNPTRMMLRGRAGKTKPKEPAQREPSEAQLQQMLQRFPAADLNRDGNLTLDEFREFRRKMRTGGTAASSRPSTASTAAANAPPTRAADASAAGPVDVQITSDKPVPVNPRVYGWACSKIFGEDFVDTPEKIDAIAELKLKIFQYGGGSGCYYHHPKGMGGLNIRPEEAAKSKHAGDPMHYTTIFASGPDHFEQYIQFVKACEGEAMFVANILNGTVAELEEYLSRLKDAGIPIACVILGQEMHLGQARSLGLEGYIERIKPYIAMLQAKYPHVPIVVHSTPVGRVVERATASFHEWNRQLAKLPGISGFSQYGWLEFGTEVRRLRGAAAQTPDERWRQYDEFTRTFPDRQLPVYQRDWGGDKKMYMTQWGTHLDRNTPVQGLHIANFYFFLAQYNAAHDDYFAMATLSQTLVEDMSKESRRTSVIYKDKIALLTPYLYTKPFRHLFSGDKKLLAASVKAAENGAKAETVKALAAAGPDGRKYLYMLNSGPAVPLGKVAVDGNPLPAELRVQVESVFGDAVAARAGSAPVKTFTGERELRELMLEPWSLTVLIMPMPTISYTSI